MECLSPPSSLPPHETYLHIDDSLPSQDILSFFHTCGHYIPYFYFLDEITFHSNNFEPYMETIITDLFTTKNIQFVAIETFYLKQNGDYRKEIHSFIEEKYPSLTSFSTEGKTYLIICTKSIEVSLKEKMPSLIKVFKYTLEQMQIEKLNDLKENEEIKEELTKAEIEEAKRKEEIRLPQINKCEFIEITHNTCVIAVDEIKRDIIVNKNKQMTYTFSFLKKYKMAQMNYVLLLYNHNTHTYTKLNYNEIKNGKVYFKISNLHSNQLYMFKLSFQYDRFYSIPERNFYFFTEYNNNNTSSSKTFIAYGNNSNHRLLLNTPQIDFSLVTNSNTNPSDVIDSNSFEHSYIKAPLALEIPITNFSMHNMQTLITLSSGKVINSGKYIISTLTEDGAFIEDDYTSTNLQRNYSASPYEISFLTKTYIRKVTLGQDHCIALSNMGVCYSWGDNWCGQLGLGKAKTITVGTPQKITFSIENNTNIFITDIQSGTNHSLALGIHKTKSVLFFFGLGQGPEISLYSQTYRGLPLPTCSSLPIQLHFENSDSIIKIYSKYNTNSIICRDVNAQLNVLYNFGINTNYQLGFYNELSDNQFNWDLPTLITFFVYKEMNVVDVKMCESYSVVLVEDVKERKRKFYASGVLPVKKETVKAYEEMDCAVNVEDVRGFAVNKMQMFFYMKNNEVVMVDKERKGERIEMKYVKVYKKEYKYEDVYMESVEDNFLLSLDNSVESDNV